MEPTVRPGSIPTASAVSINIFEPKAYAGAPPAQAPVPQVQTPQVYNYPAAPIYNYPAAPYYEVPQAPAYPPAYPPVQQPVYQAPAAQPQVAPEPQPAQAPVAPPPSAVEQQPAPAAQPAPQEAAPAPQQPAAQPAAVDVQAINTALKSANPDEQAAAIQKIAEVGQSSPEQAGTLLNEQIFRGLTDIITKDTSKLQGPEKEKSDTNKMIGMWTLAVLQKNFRDVMDVEAQKQGVPPVSINELPGIVQIVNNVKSDPNPVVREAGISALSYVAKPEDYQVLSTILDIAAKQDADPNVKAAAQQAMNNLPKPAAAPAAPAAQATQPEQQAQPAPQPEQNQQAQKAA